MIDVADLNNRFQYHPPRGDQAARYQIIRSNAGSLAHLINQNAPDSREKGLAITHLEEAVMWANAAIARNHE
jgi:hypothetical protein